MIKRSSFLVNRLTSDSICAILLSSYTYKSKDGSFSGSFTVYAIEKNKLKKHKATVTGVLIDGIGYGTATIKKIGTWAIAIK